MVSMPCVFDKGICKPLTDWAHDDFAQQRLKTTFDELLEEYHCVQNYEQN